MLSIFLAEELERTAKNSQDVSFLQYFCDNKDEKRNTAVTIIRGLIFQLLDSHQNLFGHILPSFQIQKDNLFTSASFETLWRIFETMLRDPILGTTYCVLDGLDECDKTSLEVLLKKFRALFLTNSGESPACHLNLIVVSRDLPDFIPRILSSFPRIQLDPDVDAHVNNDIHQFIEKKVDELSSHREYPEPLRVHVKEAFRKRAQGTFLWVGIVAKALEEYLVTEVENALDLFPPGLDKLYDRILLQIDIRRREIAARILRWVVMAVRPLTLSELSIAIEITTRSSIITFSPEKIMRDQVSYCGDFLRIKGDEVSLIHQSAKDYLLRKTYDPNPALEVFRVKEEAANLEIARKCLDYLQNGALAAGVIDLNTNISHLKTFPLFSYAVLHWHEHARTLAHSEDIFDLSLPFYSEKSEIRESWLKTYWTKEQYSIPPQSLPLLHLASYFGILPLARKLLLKKELRNKEKRKLYLNKPDEIGRTALHLAALGGQEAVVQLLVETGADIEAKDKYEKTALYLAAQCGHEAVVRLLMEMGADTEAKDIYERTALHLAAWGGEETVVRLLMEMGADIEAKDIYGTTALHLAARGGHETVVRLLMEMGADIEAKDTDGTTALHLAAQRGHKAVVQLLMEMGADIEAKNTDGRTALPWQLKAGIRPWCSC